MAEDIALSSQPRSQYRPTLALVGVVAAYALFNIVTSWIPQEADGVLSILGAGVFVLEPMIIGAWVALGSGSWVVRLSIAIPTLMLLLIAPAVNKASFADVEQGEFIVLALVGFAILFASMILFSVFRWLTGFRIVSEEKGTRAGKWGLRFNLKYLFVLTTLCAVVLAVTSQIGFQPNRLPGVIGLDLFILFFILGSVTLSVAVLPILSVPLFILYGRPSNRVVLNVIAVWAVFTVLSVEYWVITDEKSWPDVPKFVLLAQLGAVTASVLTAIPLRISGFRLIRHPSKNTPMQTVGALRK